MKRLYKVALTICFCSLSLLVFISSGQCQWYPSSSPTYQYPYPGYYGQSSWNSWSQVNTSPYYPWGSVSYSPIPYGPSVYSLDDTYAKERYDSFFSVVTNPDIVYDSTSQLYNSEKLGTKKALTASGGDMYGNSWNIVLPRSGPAPTIWYNGQSITGGDN
jgi:hypothetical protein